MTDMSPESGYIPPQSETEQAPGTPETAPTDLELANSWLFQRRNDSIYRLYDVGMANDGVVPEEDDQAYWTEQFEIDDLEERVRDSDESLIAELANKERERRAFIKKMEEEYRAKKGL